MIPHYTNGQVLWVSQWEAQQLDLIPVNLNGQTVYMHQWEAQQEGFGLFGSKKAKEAEKRAAAAQAAAAAASSQISTVSNALQQNIPAYQAELKQYQAIINKEVERVGASLPTTLAYIGAGTGVATLLYVALDKFVLNRKRK